MVKQKKKLNARLVEPNQYLGGLTSGTLLGRPHMGPGNIVARKPLNAQDRPYWVHDKGYGAIMSPYGNYNRYDALLNKNKSSAFVDNLAKDAFFAKNVLDIYNVPTLYKGGLKSPFKKIDSKSIVPYEKNFSYTDVVFPTSMSVNPEKPRSRPPGSGIYSGMNPTVGGGSHFGHLRGSIRYEKY